MILVLLIRSIRAERKAIEEERLIHALNKQVFEDALTHVRNKGGFDNYTRERNSSTFALSKTAINCVREYRIGGDEFIMILMGEDYQNREELIRRFEEAQKEICSSTKNRWEQVHVALGIAEYDPETDRSLNDTVRRSDQLMYENKRNRKT